MLSEALRGLLRELGRGLGIALLTLPVATSAAALPAVSAELKIASAEFSAGLKQAKGEVERDVSTWLAKELGTYFGYLRWVGADASPRPDDSLVVTLADRPSACEVSMFLVFSGRLKGRDVSFPGVQELPFDDLCNFDIATDDPDQLIDQLQQELSSQLANQAFRDQIEGKLLHEISLAKEVLIEDQSIGLPFSLEDLRSSRKSLLLVVFSAGASASAAEEGTIQVRTALGWGARIRCNVEEFLYPSAQIPVPTLQHPQFAEILAADRLRSVDVYMRVYDQSLAPGGATAGPVTSGPFQ